MRLLAALAAAALLGAGGAAFGVSSARRHARQSISTIRHGVPRARGASVGGCRRHGRRRVDCRFAITIRALSGGTTTCTGVVRVSKGPRSAFPGRPHCTRRRR